MGEDIKAQGVSVLVLHEGSPAPAVRPDDLGVSKNKPPGLNTYHKGHKLDLGVFLKGFWLVWTCALFCSGLL